MRLPNQTSSMKQKNVASKQNQPYRIRIPGLANNDIGLGDVVKTITTKAGFKPCGGCQRRAATLNQWVVFSTKKQSR